MLTVVRTLANWIRQPSLLTEADRRDLSTWTKSLRACLRLRRYYGWDSELLHDEGWVLGIQQAGQSDTDPLHPKQARCNFVRDIDNLDSLVGLLEVSPTLWSEQQVNPQTLATYQPNTAFIMMQIDSYNPEIDDLYHLIKDCFSKFDITAVRSDEMEHEGLIAQKIIEKIESSEFLLADLTGERPNVYYEIGYAHSCGRKVTMYRRKDTKLHFDLSAYNCPEYVSLTDLKGKLMKRIEDITNRRPRA